MIETLDADSANLSETISIKIPITIPYASDSREYERIDGVIEHNGEFLRFVKQRLYRDTLEIVCIRDVQHKKINQALVDYASSLTDKTSDMPASKAIEFIKEYLSTTISLSGAAEGWAKTIALTQVATVLHSFYFPSIIHPPERS